MRDVTPLGAALDLNPTSVLIIRASPTGKSPSDKHFGGLIPIGLRSVNLLQSEVSRNDLANTGLINDMLAARDNLARALQTEGVTGAAAQRILHPLDLQLAKYRFAQVRLIEPTKEYSDTLEFNPAKISAAMDAGRAAVEQQWPLLEPLVSD